MKQKTVLVAENHADLQQAYAAIFHFEKYKVDFADTQEEALEKLKQSTYDVVVVDKLYRRGINGLDLMEAYKRDTTINRTHKQPVFIAIVDDEDHEEKIRALADGSFIMGQFTPGEVLEKVEACLQKRKGLHAASVPL